jgi:2-oxoglutarate ferredoxin oxidoreductase subunit alpha
MSRSEISIALTGSGGAGAITAGELLLRLVGRAGGYGLMRRAFGPQIRGGEAASLLRLGTRPVACMNDSYDLFLALDWRNAERFADETPLREGSLIIADPDAGDLPPAFAERGARVVDLPLKALAAAVDGGRPNMVALGALAGLVGLDPASGAQLVESHFLSRGAAVAAASAAAFRAGFGAVDAPDVAPVAWSGDGSGRWSLTGNEGCGLGALRGGIRFAAAYPITPASDLLEWLAPRLEQFGGCLLQAEDELASVNMVIGASFGGVPALTATSGPGLSLMLEGLGLAVASETPAVVVNVMRGGPSTGIPTKSEQADLDQALHGMHGDAPHLVLGALDHGDCVLTTEWATRLAEHLQTVAIVLSDQNLAQSRVILEPPKSTLPEIPARVVATSPGEAFERYALTGSGVSPMTQPGIPGGMYVADGLEHDGAGRPTTAADVHQAQLDKRARKLEDFDFGPHWADISGENAPLAILTWGSTTGAVREAAERLAAGGNATRIIALRLLLPARPAAMAEALSGVERVLVVEQSHGKQFARYLRAHYDIAAETRVLARPGPLLFTPGEIVSFVERWTAEGARP